jgi:glycosyltransferase involved in cell wall biosynthesis
MQREEKSPLISVVTPFFNAAKYLDKCIESVLCQSLGDFEYVLVDNCSTDGSLSIAERHAARDTRIRLIRATEFRGQVENYNYGLSLIAHTSRYCKIVQADDWIYPNCLEAMVGVAERDSRIGIVSAYSLWGRTLLGQGLEVDEWHVPGRNAARMQMLENVFFMGSPTAIMYRADLVQSRQPFYELGRYHEDTEVAYEILRTHDLGFVHQVLSYMRVDPGSIMGQRTSYMPYLLDRLINLERYGKYFLSPEELAQEHKQSQQALVRFLGRSLLRGREPEFWRYQKEGFNTMGRPWPRLQILASAINQTLNILLNPKSAFESALRRLRRIMRPC